MARIIVVDDDDIVTEIVAEALERAGHLVSAVSRGDEATGAIQQSEPDLLVLDYALPGKSGMQILREVRLLPLASMPVMMLTSRGGRIHRLQADQDGADDYVVKPFDVDDVVARVEALLVGSAISRNVVRAAACRQVRDTPE